MWVRLARTCHRATNTQPHRAIRLAVLLRCGSFRCAIYFAVARRRVIACLANKFRKTLSDKISHFTLKLFIDRKEFLSLLG